MNWEVPFIVSKVIHNGTYKLATLEGEESARSINGKFLKRYYPTMQEGIKSHGDEDVSHKPAK